MFFVSLMKMTLLAIVSYSIVKFIRKDLASLIIALYAFAVVTMFVTEVVPHIQHIAESLDKITSIIKPFVGQSAK